MTAATTPRIRTFGVGIQRRQRAGSDRGLSTGGIGAAGRVGVVVVMYSPQGRFGLLQRGLAGGSAADVVAFLEQRAVAVAPLLLLVEQLVDVDWDDLETLQRI